MRRISFKNGKTKARVRGTRAFALIYGGFPVKEMEELDLQSYYNLYLRNFCFQTVIIYRKLKKCLRIKA